jgi:hypothetical protein
MPRSRVLTAALAAALLVCGPGCITLFSKTEVVRESEARRAVAFESQEAAEVFHRAVKKRSKEIGGAYVGVPFVTLYNRDRVLSDAAHFNDAVARCDTNQDGLITLAEAQVFANMQD